MLTLARRLVFWVVFPYFLFLAFVKCPSGDQPSDVVSQITCASLQNYVYPAWDLHVQPVIGLVDEKTQISAKLAPLAVTAKSHWHQLDSQYQITYHSSVAGAKARLWAVDTWEKTSRVLGAQLGYWWARFLAYYRDSMTPLLVYWGGQYRSVLEGGVDYTVRHFRLKSWLVASYFRSQSARISTVYVMPFTAKVWAQIQKSEPVVALLRSAPVEWLVEKSSHFYKVFLEKSALVNASLQAKKDFVRAEFANLGKNPSTPKSTQEREAIATVVGKILDAVVSESRENSETKESTSGSESVTESDSESNLLSESVFSTATELFDLDDSDSEPETQTLTKTITHTSGAPSAVAIHEDEDVIAYGSDSSQAQLDHELAYWESKVQKTLDLATGSLESEMEPYLNGVIEELKEKISANFSSLSQETYRRYAAMADLIAKIDKDSEFISEHQQIIEEPEVHRQVMRDHIAECNQVVEFAMKHVETHLNEAHGEIMAQYFETAQLTVDVLESFADTAVSDFSARLTALIDILQHNADFQDSMSWAAWKRFHKVKESIFQIRDKIFDEANAYKTAPRGTKVPMGLSLWARYLNNINFHIRFLTQDNAEYLQIVRAKANVAYQQREFLSYELEQKQKKDAEDAEKAEADKAEVDAEIEAESAEIAENAGAENAEEESTESDYVAPGVVVEELTSETLTLTETVEATVEDEAAFSILPIDESEPEEVFSILPVDEPEAVFSILPVDDAQELEADESIERVPEEVEEA